MKQILLSTIIFFAANSFAENLGKVLEYKEKGTTLSGYMAETPNKMKKVPGFLIVHDWMGLSDENIKEAEALASKGAVAMAVDVYGKGVRPKSADEAGKLATLYKSDRKLFKARMKAAYDQLLANKKVDPTKIVVLGYCFGGTAALELARSGVNLAGVVSYHGGLESSDAKEANNIKGKVLVLHGAIDPWVPATEVAAFQKEMDTAKKDYQLISYSGAVHAFTSKNAGNDITKGAAYDAVADKRSRKQFEMFTAETVGM